MPSALDAPGASKTLPVGILRISNDPLRAPTPVSDTVPTAPLALRGILSVAERLPNKSGVKATLTEQVARGCKLAGQLLQKANEPGLAPERMKLPVGIACALELVTVMVGAVLPVRTLRLLKVSEVGEMVRVGASVG